MHRGASWGGHQPAGGQIRSPSRLLVKGDEDGRGHNIVISASARTSGIVPADVEIPVALGTAHGSRALLEAGALPAGGAEARAGAPGDPQAGGEGGAGANGSPGR